MSKNNQNKTPENTDASSLIINANNNGSNRVENSSNSNNNTFNITNINTYQKENSNKSTRVMANPNWLVKLIIGGIITLILSLATYYIKGIQSSGKGTPPNAPIENQINGTKQ